MHEQSSLWPTHATEEWRAVPGYEGQYEISDLGRVRSWFNSNRHRMPEPRVRRPYPNWAGYLLIKLRGRGKAVHRLVLETFVGPAPNGHVCAHENGRRDDNRLANLSWKTSAENCFDKVRHGTAQVGDRSSSRLRPERLARGERNGLARLTGVQVVMIRAASAHGESQTALAARYGVSRRSIFNIVQGRTWRHV